MSEKSRTQSDQWPLYNLNEVYSFASGLSKNRKDFGYGFPFVAFKDVFDNFFLPRELKNLANTTEKERQTCSVKRGDVFLTRTSETQEELAMSSVALIDYPDATFNGFTKRLRPLGTIEVLPEYAGFYFRSPRFRAEVTSMSSITTRASLNNDMLAALRVSVPSVPEQRAIASVLSSIDDKIDLLHRQNKTLEAMAETLFRQWFVEEAQEDWEEGMLGDIVTVVSGTTPKTDKPEYWNGEYHWTSPRDVTNLTGLFLFDTERKITKRGLEQIGSGLLPTGSLLMSSRAPVGALAFAEIPVAINQGYAGIICDKGFSREFVYLWLKTNMDFVQSHANGSTFQEISKSAFRQLDISIPDSVSYLEFHSSVFPAFAKIKSNSLQIRTLESLRDTLLPKLMSGEVRVAV